MVEYFLGYILLMKCARIIPNVVQSSYIAVYNTESGK